MSRLRKDNLHKISSNIINENQVIVVERLNIKGLTKRCKPKQDENGNFVKNGQSAKSGLNKSILDAGLGMFLEMLRYKAEWAGRTFIEVPPMYTSMDCNSCGHRNHNLKLIDRSWVCEGCGVEHDRDVNAAVNILKKGLDKLNEGGGARLLNLERQMEISSLVAAGAEEPLHTN